MPPEKLFNFFGEKEFMNLIDKTDEFLKIDPKVDGEKDGKVAMFLYKYFLERLSGSTLKDFAKKVLDFLSEEEIDNLLNFINQNFFELREQLWQEEPESKSENQEEIEIQKPETFEEKEKRYLELMEPIIKTQSVIPPKEIKEKSEEKPEEKEFKTISFEPVENKKEIETPIEEITETPAETTIVIRKKEEKTKENGEDVLDLSRL